MHPERYVEANRRRRVPWPVRSPLNSRERARLQAARKFGYAPPPLERDCPPRPADGCCQYCHAPVGVAKLYMDHNHETGAFLAWCCHRCNLLITDRIGPLGETPWRR
jgi:hypothetical protein